MGTALAGNDNWGHDTSLSATFASVSAFALADPKSKDAGLIRTLDPGNYSVQASGIAGTTGMALVEIHEVK